MMMMMVLVLLMLVVDVNVNVQFSSLELANVFYFLLFLCFFSKVKVFVFNLKENKMYLNYAGSTCAVC